uniref:Bm10758, isoform b n=1 Tax=Brugia malayi TaxID=6279 RepID=A0A1I9G491_BRUMA|nr:Bm10758, isoform b [Brugia malayi]
MFRLVRRHGDVDIVVLVHCDGPLRLANRSTSKFSKGTNTRGAGMRKIRKMGGHWKVQGGSRSADGVTLTPLTLMEFFLYISRADEA